MAWWSFQSDLVSLSVESGAYLGFDMSHPVWTGKSTEHIDYPGWVMDLFRRGWPEPQPCGASPLPGAIEWLWKQYAELES